MKNLLLIAFATLGVALSNAQTATQPRQPLYIPSLTIIPNGCSNQTATLEVVASGGQPTSSGNYTYSLDSASQTSPTATFANVTAYQFHILTVTDTANTSITWSIIFSQSQTGSVNISSTLPLGDGSGCITLSAVDVPASGSQVDFLLFNPNEQAVVLLAAPYTHTFSAPPAASNNLALIAVSGDCGQAFSIFNVSFPFPQGKANALRTYLVNKFCANCGQGTAA